MGASCSVGIKVGDYDDNSDLQCFINSFKIQSSDFAHYHKIFIEFEDQLGALSEIDHIITSIDDDDTRDYLLFQRRLLSIFDEDSTGYINFADFMVSMWNFCSIDKEHISEFLFNLYDTNLNDTLSKEEITILFKEIFGKNSSKVMSESLELKECDAYSPKSFKALVKKHADIFKPIIKLQESIKQKTGGDDYWRTQCINRSKTCPTEIFCPLEEFIKKHVPPHFYVNATKRRFRRLEEVLRMTASTPDGSDKKMTSNANHNIQTRHDSPFNEAFRLRESQRILETISRRQEHQSLDTEEDFSGSNSSHGNGYIRKHLHDNESYGNKYQHQRYHRGNCNHETHSYDNSNKKDPFLLKTRYKRYKLSRETGYIYAE